MADCIFCKIVADEIPATRVLEDDQTLAFLDIGPLAAGHTLVIPKAHGAKLVDLLEEDAMALMRTARRLLPALGAAVDAPDTTIAIHDGPAAGQEVGHVHMHLVPRKPGDDGGPIHALFRQRPAGDPEALGKLAEDIRGRIGG